MLRRDDVLQFLRRDWAGLERSGRSYRVRAIRARGLGEAVRMMETLYAAAKEADPSWPTQAERDDDLATHRRVAALLARTASRRHPAR